MVCQTGGVCHAGQRKQQYLNMTWYNFLWLCFFIYHPQCLITTRIICRKGQPKHCKYYNKLIWKLQWVLLQATMVLVKASPPFGSILVHTINTVLLYLTWLDEWAARSPVSHIHANLSFPSKMKTFTDYSHSKSALIKSLKLVWAWACEMVAGLTTLEELPSLPVSIQNHF